MSSETTETQQEDLASVCPSCKKEGVKFNFNGSLVNREVICPVCGWKHVIEDDANNDSMPKMCGKCWNPDVMLHAYIRNAKTTCSECGEVVRYDSAVPIRWPVKRINFKG